MKKSFFEAWSEVIKDMPLNLLKEQPMTTKLEGIRKRTARTERDLKESGAVTWLTAESDRAYLLRLVDAYRELDAATHDANIAVADPVHQKPAAKEAQPSEINRCDCGALLCCEQDQCKHLSPRGDSLRKVLHHADNGVCNPQPSECPGLCDDKRHMHSRPITADHYKPHHPDGSPCSHDQGLADAAGSESPVETAPSDAALADSSKPSPLHPGAMEVAWKAWHITHEVELKNTWEAIATKPETPSRRLMRRWLEPIARLISDLLERELAKERQK